MSIWQGLSDLLLTEMHLFVGKWRWRRITEWIVEPIMYVYIDTCMQLCILHLYSHIPSNTDSEIWYHDISYQTNHDFLYREELFIVSRLPLPWFIIALAKKCATQYSYADKKNIISLKLTASPENGWLEDFLVSFWVLAYFQVQTVSFRECTPLGTGVAIFVWTK